MVFQAFTPIVTGKQSQLFATVHAFLLQELQKLNLVYLGYFSLFYAQTEKGKILNMQNLHLYQDYFEKQAFKIHFIVVAVCSLQSFGTLSTVNFSIMANKALVGQTTGTLCTFETIIVPGFIFIVNHTGSSSKSCQERKQLQDGDSSYSRGWVSPSSSRSHSSCLPCDHICNI